MATTISIERFFSKVSQIINDERHALSFENTCIWMTLAENIVIPHTD